MFDEIDVLMCEYFSNTKHVFTVENVIAVAWTKIAVEADYKPALFFFSSEKGAFGEVYVETDGADFDPELLANRTT